jgi:hypothetical protein
MAENKETVSELGKLGVTYMLVTPSPDGKVSVSDQVLNLRTLSEAFIRKSSYIG